MGEFISILRISLSGHNKWSKIKRQKGAADAKKGAIFGKLVKQIVVAVKAGGATIEDNPSLRVVLEKCKEASMPSDNIKRAIAKASGTLDGANYEEITYEGYGLGGVAIIVETLTDNKNRTVANVRHAFSKCGGNMGESGSVAWMFENKGIVVTARGENDETVMECAIENGADDIDEQEDVLVIFCAPEIHNSLLSALGDAQVDIEEQTIELVAQNKIAPSEDDLIKIEKLIDMLEDDDDVQSVVTNMK